MAKEEAINYTEQCILKNLGENHADEVDLTVLNKIIQKASNQEITLKDIFSILFANPFDLGLEAAKLSMQDLENPWEISMNTAIEDSADFSELDLSDSLLSDMRGDEEIRISHRDDRKSLEI